MDTVIVLERDTPTNVRLLGSDHSPADPDYPVRRAHTALAEASGLCGPLTLCGLDTSEMTLAPLRAGDPGRASVLPHWNTCGTCRHAGERTAPRTTGRSVASTAQHAARSAAQHDAPDDTPNAAPNAAPGDAPDDTPETTGVAETQAS
ncbi:hypothetical protein [Kitasatospora sp. NPDC059599]|uniref:hypothetical protein n=1 Tax=Kitasatospora sp. NPDC059599 TaxID=3346880 RepID=UPI0036855287